MNVLRESRAALARKLPVQTHRIAGVTFEGRQSTLKLLRELLPDEASASLMFEKEPENPFDANAVAVKLVDDTKLGYVPARRLARSDTRCASADSGVWVWRRKHPTLDVSSRFSRSCRR